VVPVIMERSVKRPEDGGKLERLRRIATEAAQQCGRVDVPEVPGYAGLDEFLKMTAEAQLKILPYEGEKARGLREVFAGLRSCRQKEKAADTGLQASHQPEGDHSHPPLVRDLQHHAQHLPPLDGTPEGPCWNLAGGRTAGQINSFAVAVLIGPEGGLTEDEVKKAEEAGFIPVSLGPRILRTETAGLAVVVLVQYQLGDI
jgi:16S rRNA U1498 N3-methylase RsmE